MTEKKDIKILVTGVEGYVGYPLCCKLETIFKKEQIIKVDSLFKQKWLNKITQKCPCEYIPKNHGFIVGDLCDRDFVDEILKIHKPDVIIHLASQPSLPYSQLNWERASFTQWNNLSMNLNLLWGLRENGLTNTKYIITTTTGIPGQFYAHIPEGHTFNMAGSWYHISRGFDSANCNLASRQWGIQIIEFRTSIVYGLKIEEFKQDYENVMYECRENFNTDFYFGTALNRFIQQAIDGKPLTIYGEGNQTKPFISLEDCCQSIVNSITYSFNDKHTILNQTTENISIKQLAELIASYLNIKIEHIPNPRQEKEDFEMFFDNQKFLNVLGHPKQLIKDGIKEMIEILK